MARCSEQRNEVPTKPNKEVRGQVPLHHRHDIIRCSRSHRIDEAGHDSLYVLRQQCALPSKKCWTGNTMEEHQNRCPNVDLLWAMTYWIGDVGDPCLVHASTCMATADCLFIRRVQRYKPHWQRGRPELPTPPRPGAGDWTCLAMSKATVLADLRIILRHLKRLPSNSVNSFKTHTLAQVGTCPLRITDMQVVDRAYYSCIIIGSSDRLLSFPYVELDNTCYIVQPRKTTSRQQPHTHLRCSVLLLVSF